MATAPKRNKHAQELFDLLNNKKTSIKELDDFGWLSIDQMDGELLVMMVSHPSCGYSNFSRSIGMAIKFTDSIFRSVIIAAFKNKKRFTKKAWNEVSRWAILPEYYGSFFKNMTTILRSSDNHIFTPEQYKWLFTSGVVREIGISEKVARKEYVDYLTAILDAQKNSVEELFTELFFEASYLQKRDFLATTRDGTIFEAINASKNAPQILAFLYSLSGNEAYLPQVLQDIFLW